MGRELTDLNMDKKPNYIETKDYEIKECTEEHSAQKPGVPSAKSGNFDAVLRDVDEKPRSQKPSPVMVESAAAESGAINKTDNGNIVQSPRASSTPEPKSPEATLKMFQSDKKHTDDDDSWSLASSTATFVRTNKSRVTVGSAPKFKCSDRAERRKEFYTKLEQKQKALEEEKLRSEQRRKEEQEAAMRQLRKNLIYKANPVPSFYYEPPPPKPEVKKFPLTRPKSPKLNRRRSCSDATNLTQEEKTKCTQMGRRSLGSYRAASSSSSTNNAKNSAHLSIAMDHPKLKTNKR